MIPISQNGQEETALLFGQTRELIYITEEY